MLTLLFAIFMMGFIFKGIGLAFKLSWGIISTLLIIVFWPIILIGLVLFGLIQLALPLLAIAAVILLVKSFSENDSIIA